VEGGGSKKVKYGTPYEDTGGIHRMRERLRPRLFCSNWGSPSVRLSLYPSACLSACPSVCLSGSLPTPYGTE
jgi:hypothetical protein